MSLSAASTLPLHGSVDGNSTTSLGPLWHCCARSCRARAAGWETSTLRFNGKLYFTRQKAKGVQISTIPSLPSPAPSSCDIFLFAFIDFRTGLPPPGSWPGQVPYHQCLTLLEMLPRAARRWDGRKVLAVTGRRQGSASALSTLILCCCQEQSAAGWSMMLASTQRRSLHFRLILGMKGAAFISLSKQTEHRTRRDFTERRQTFQFSA